MSLLFVTLLLVTLLTPVASAAVYTVYPDGSGSYPTIQAAVSASAGGDTIRLGNGVFTGTGNRDLQVDRPRVFLSASGDPTACILDAEGYALGTLGVDPDPSEHFYFQGIGFRDGIGLRAQWNKQVHFTRCRFESCAGAIELAGYVVDSGHLFMDDCDVIACTPTPGTWSGTLIVAETASIRNCRFTANSSPEEYGVQLVYAQYPTIEGCTFADNTNAGGNAALVGSMGGETYFGASLYRDCLFIGNQTGHCAMAYREDAHFERCRFENNLGNGIDLYTEYDYNPHLSQVWDCVFLGNAGSGIIRYDIGLELVGCSFVHGGGAADIVAWSSVPAVPLTIDRCLFALRFAGPVLLEQNPTPALAVACTDIYGIVDGEWSGPLAPFFGVDGNFTADPLLCDWLSGNLTLFNTSPCLPANNSCGVRIGAEGQGCTSPTAAEIAPGDGLRLTAAPNPFNPKTRLSFSLPEAARVHLAIYDAAGRRVALLLDGDPGPAGEQAIDWNAAGIASGVYLARLEAGERRQETKLTLLR